MPAHNFDRPRGRLAELSWDAETLRGNALGDPSERSVAVYLPPEYDRSDADFPLIVELAAFTGSGWKRVGWRAFGESAPQRLDRLTAEGRMGPVIAAFPDGFTSLGGNQYLDSPVLGNWSTYLLDEMIPRLEDGFRVRRGPAHRAIVGRSSGGYGAIVQGLRHGTRWGAVACHSGDMMFEWAYLHDLPVAIEALARHHGDVQALLRATRAAERIDGPAMTTLMVLALAASYDPDPDAPGSIRLPVEPSTCEIVAARWARWKHHDPVELARRPECIANLRALRAVYFDCGSRDEYRLHYGARLLARRLREAGVEHVHEEFDGGHSDADHRFDRSLPLVYEAIR